jgi:hypothetical protein
MNRILLRTTVSGIPVYAGHVAALFRWNLVSLVSARAVLSRQFAVPSNDLNPNYWLWRTSARTRRHCPSIVMCLARREMNIYEELRSVPCI